ncbi:vitellogenin-1-like [Frankliniella occidentalis]|uniref:Vitellogenin-1-like n=1 Tax=Frankliniella occidentalis TaxID=133901 RepID=A0A9C6TUZ5_FRAOC|nr:vitellogenin-1-like [Frankliniella occidentalis]
MKQTSARSSSENKEQQLAMTISAKMPNVPAMNFQKALNADPKSQIQAQIAFGEKLDSSASQININAQMKQTSARREFVRRQPTAQLCEQQMEHGNNFLPACQNVTAQANIMDLYNVNINFDKISQRVKNCTYKAYAAARYFGWQYSSENFVNPKNSHNNKVELELRFAPNMKSANLSIDAPAMSAEFNNVRLNHWVARAAAVHPMYSQSQLLVSKALKGGYPMCVVDKTAANTFDNKTYPLNLGNNWHVMMQSVPKVNADSSSSSSSQEDATDKVAVLVRDASSSHDQKELKVILDENVIDFTPASGYSNIKYNGHSVSFSSNTGAQIQDQSGDILAQVFPMPANTIKVYFPQQKLEILYDGNRIALIVGQTYRGEVRGLCGTFNGEEVSDFTAPRNCVLKNAQQFAASWAINPSGAVKEQQQKANHAACFPERILYGDVISDNEAGRYQPRHSRSSSKSHKSSSSSRKSSPKTAAGCTSHRVKVIEQDGQICFSLRPQPACNAHCQPTQKVEKKIDFHCVSDSSASRHWAQMIKKGANPDFSQKGANKSLKVNIPESCRA